MTDPAGEEALRHEDLVLLPFARVDYLLAADEDEPPTPLRQGPLLDADELPSRKVLSKLQADNARLQDSVSRLERSMSRLPTKEDLHASNAHQAEVIIADNQRQTGIVTACVGDNVKALGGGIAALSAQSTATAAALSQQAGDAANGMAKMMAALSDVATTSAQGVAAATRSEQAAVAAAKIAKACSGAAIDCLQQSKVGTVDSDSTSS